ncbi:MAG: class I SAM-dependent methyltransferase [Bacteroidetes bacterium]|nr:class I SAM-dependent methyltransferase [Bacteroidota bacterium]
MKNWFKSWFNSPYYHLLYYKRDDNEAAEFISKLIDYLNPEAGSRMLDVACGKGRHSLQLADKGFDVTGIDLSEESIEEAKQNERRNLHFFRHDMRYPFWSNYFNYVFNFFTSFGYFDSSRENKSALRTISKALKPGGIFVIDYLNVKYSEKKNISHEQKNIEGIIFDIERSSDNKAFYKKIKITDSSKNYKEEFYERVSKFSLQDLTAMLEEQSLSKFEVFGDYNLNPYDENNSPRLIICAKKLS